MGLPALVVLVVLVGPVPDAPGDLDPSIDVVVGLPVVCWLGVAAPGLDPDTVRCPVDAPLVAPASAEPASANGALAPQPPSNAATAARAARSPMTRHTSFRCRKTWVSMS